MGPSISRPQNQQIANISKNLLIQLAFPQVSQKFQKAQFFYKTRQMKIHIPVDNPSIIKSWDSNIQIFHQNQMKFFLLLPKSYQFQKQAYCGSAGIAKIIYDYFPYSLQGQIQNRKKSIDNQQFSQVQIWKIFYTLLKASDLMHKNWKKIGDIRPKNIFYNQERQLRISCQYSYPRQLTNFQKFIFQKQSTYLSPQQIHDIKMGRIDPDQSRNAKQHIIQAQSWSIGLTLLHVALLFNCQKIYSPLNCQINLDLLQQKIVDLQNKKNLPLALKNIIKSMIQQIPERRLLTSELFLNFIQPYSENIIKMEKFDTVKLNLNIKQFMQKKSVNSLIGTVWKACTNGLIQSLVINNIKSERNQTQNRAKEALIQQLEKYSQIHPKQSQVSMRDSIRLGGSIRKLNGSLAKRRTSQASNQSFHTVNSLKFSKKQGFLNNPNRISNFSLQNRFGFQKLPTSGEHFSPMKTYNFDNISQKFMTPLQQSSYFQTIHANEKSFDFNNLGLLGSTFRNSQTIQDKDFANKISGKDKQLLTNPILDGNFKKQKSKQKQ